MGIIGALAALANPAQAQQPTSTPDADPANPPAMLAHSGTTATEATVAELVEQLTSDHYRQRERAQQRLRGLGRQAVPALVARLTETTSAEAVYRIQRILTQIGEDFLVLCSHLDDRHARIRHYAEEALTLRLLGDSTSTGVRAVLAGPAWGEQVRFLPETAPNRPRLNAVRLTGFDGGFTGTAAEFFARVNETVPVVLAPSAFDAPGFVTATLSLERAQLINTESALRHVGNTARLSATEIELSGVRAVVVADSQATPAMKSERDVALALCRGVLHEIPAARHHATAALGRFFGHKVTVVAMWAESLAIADNPCADDLLVATMFSGHPMSVIFPQVPNALVERAAKALYHGDWSARQAAMRALVTWRPAPLTPSPRTLNAEARQRAEADYRAQLTTFAHTVLPHLDAALTADQPTVRYLAAWGVGALKPIWADLSADREWAEKLAHRLGDTEPMVARQALESLAFLAPNPPPAVPQALQLGFAGEHPDLRDAALHYLRQAQSPELFSQLLARFSPDVPRETRLFVAQLLGDARDFSTLGKLIAQLRVETDEEISAALLRAFTPAFTDESAWPLLEPMLASEDRHDRRVAGQIIVRSRLPARSVRIRAVLSEAQEPGRKVEWQIVLFRLGENSLLDVLAETVRGDDEQLAKDAAIGLGEALSDDALQVFQECFQSEKELTRLAALHGIDAFGRLCAETGNVERSNLAYRLLFNFYRDPSTAVKNLAQQVRTNFSGPNGYRQQAMNVRNQALRTPGEDKAFPALPRDARFAR